MLLRLVGLLSVMVMHIARFRKGLFHTLLVFVWRCIGDSAFRSRSEGVIKYRTNPDSGSSQGGVFVDYVYFVAKHAPHQPHRRLSCPVKSALVHSTGAVV